MDTSDCEELGRDDDCESLSRFLRRPDRFFRSGGDCSGVMRSWCSSESLEGRVTGENSGSGTETDESLASVDPFSVDTLMAGPRCGAGACALRPDCELRWTDERSMDRDPRSDSDWIVDSCELHWCTGRCIRECLPRESARELLASGARTTG